MGWEIERKFIVNKKEWEKISKPRGKHLQQGYLLTDPEKTIRIRITDDKAYLTIKGITKGATRKEFEYEIPKSDANELLMNFSVSGLTKTRYKMRYKGKTWEVDEFLGDNTGLIMAEIELKRENEEIEIPEWIDKEVTAEEKYYNSNLSVNPYKNWKSKIKR